MRILNLYFKKKVALIVKQISEDLNHKTIDKVLETFLLDQITDKGSASFQSYYFETLSNEKHFMIFENFFHKFKKQYSLQGIDNDYLKHLENNKLNILTLIQGDKLTELYFEYFANANIKHGNTKISKDLGSFFAKFVHTFKPHEYCALDNPIKNEFGLQRESFFIAFCLISSAYKLWSSDNKSVLEDLRSKFEHIDKQKIIQHDRLSDMKLLDLIYWSKANKT